MSAVSFGIIGGGWRAEFFLRIARELPERFRVTGMMLRDAEKGRAFEEAWGVPTFRSVRELLDRTEAAFVVVSVPRAVAPGMLRELAEAGMPALCETPPAETVEAMSELYRAVGSGARIQIAEQYPFQPNHAARLAVVRSGKLGRVFSAEVSAAHDYHGIVLLRRYLDIGFDNAEIRGTSFRSPIVGGPGRAGDPEAFRIDESVQTIATFDFGGKFGLYDFTGEQYFSWFRSKRVRIRGDHGEIETSDVRYLLDYKTPVETRLTRIQAGQDGNLEGHHLRSILCGGDYVYRNPFEPGRLSDDEIAVADCLARMGVYAAGGPSFYSLAEACQDHYLGLVMHEAVRTGETLRTETQVWAEN